MFRVLTRHSIGRNLIQCTKISKNISRRNHIPATIIPTINAVTDETTPLDTLEIEPIRKVSTRNQPLIKVGDYVEAFRNGQYSGMVVGEKASSGGLQQLTVLLRNGKTFNVRSDSVAFYIKEFYRSQQVSQSVVNLLNIHEIDSNGLLKNVPVAYQRAIQYYQRTVSMFKGSSHKDLDQLYKRFIKTQSNVTLDELAAAAFKVKNPTDLQRHATFLHLVSDNIHFIPTVDVRVSDTWQLRSPEACKKVETIIDSIRSRNKEYTGFLSRMKSLVQFYNTHADPVLGTIPKSSLNSLPEIIKDIEPSDKTYVDFIVDWIRSPRVIVDSPHEVFVPTILKSLRVYDDLFVDRELAVQFLKQIGMFKPWDNVGLIEDSAVINEFIWSEKAKENERKMNEYTNAFLSGKDAGFNRDDVYERIRHDFGDLPVYTIDDPTAKEIDDGISIEHIPGDKSAWLHVHIADPTTYISPQHELSNLISQRTQTLYLPECHVPMLPEELSSKKFSLGTTAHTNANGSQYALTFSTRLSSDGDLIDFKVRPSLVRNVHKLYYDDVDQLLTPLAKPFTDPLLDFTRTFSHPAGLKQSPAESNPVPQQAHKDLFDIFHMTKRHGGFRIKNGAILFSRPSPILDITPSPLALPQTQFQKASYASQLPEVRLRLDRSTYSASRTMVAETMIMAGRVASRYAQSQEIPIPFRSQQWNPHATTSEINARDEMLASRDENGMIQMRDMVRFMGVLPPTRVSTQAGPHVVMGIQDGYTRATSPLRRYMDFIVHWQLKARLMGHALPFNQTDVRRLGFEVTVKEKQLQMLQQKSIQFWVMRLLEGSQDVWRCIVNAPNRVAFTELGGAMDVTTGTLLELGVRGRIEKLDRKLQVGDVVNVRIKSLEPSLGRINLELI